jgi:hypothetical protein
MQPVDPFPTLYGNDPNNIVDIASRDKWLEFRKPSNHLMAEGQRVKSVNGEEKLGSGPRYKKAHSRKRWHPLQI